MSALQVVLMIVGILVGIAIINLAVWIPVVAKLKRTTATLGDELRAAGERVISGPERALFCGATAEFGKVNGLGVIALTEQRVIFRKVWGLPVEVPINRVKSLREDKWFRGAYRSGQLHLILVLDSGTEVGFIVQDHPAWKAAIEDYLASR